MTLAKRKIVDHIQQVRLPHPIVSKETIHFRRESDFRLKNIFIIENRKLFEYHLYHINRTKLKNILLSIDYISKKNYFCALNCHWHKSVDKNNK